MKVKSKHRGASNAVSGPPGERDVANQDERVEHRAQVAVECPQCHWRQFMEVNLDKTAADKAYGREIQALIQEWLRTRCPDHLGTFLEISKN